jgi:hypothetical protein
MFVTAMSIAIADKTPAGNRWENPWNFAQNRLRVSAIPASCCYQWRASLGAGSYSFLAVIVLLALIAAPMSSCPGRGLARTAGEDFSRGAQHDHEEKSSYGPCLFLTSVVSR